MSLKKLKWKLDLSALFYLVLTDSGLDNSPSPPPPLEGDLLAAFRTSPTIFSTSILLSGCSCLPISAVRQLKIMNEELKM